MFWSFYLMLSSSHLSSFRWLIYEEPGFQGVPLMLEPGEYPNLAFWEKKEAYIRSMRPLKMVTFCCCYLQVTWPVFVLERTCSRGCVCWGSQRGNSFKPKCFSICLYPLLPPCFHSCSARRVSPSFCLFVCVKSDWLLELPINCLSADNSGFFPFLLCFFCQGGRKVEFSGEPKVKVNIYLIVQRSFLTPALHVER